MLESHRLRVFVEVVHAGSIASAARKLRFTSSAVSQQIGKLEGEIGQKLLIRQAGGVLLTPSGQVLVEHAELILAELDAAHAAAQMAAAGPGTMTVASFASAAWAFAANALSSFAERRPEVALRLLDIEPPDGYGEVRSGEIDILLTHCYPGVDLPPDRGLRRDLIVEEPLRLVAHHRVFDEHRNAALYATDRPALLAEFDDQLWITGGPGTPSRRLLSYLAEREGMTPRVAYETADYRLTTELVGAGLGMSIVPESVCADAGSNIRALPIAGMPVRQILLVRRARTTTVIEEMEVFLRIAAHRLRASDFGRTRTGR
jgi:DNA-binding transcriptional LysR family regulator